MQSSLALSALPEVPVFRARLRAALRGGCEEARCRGRRSSRGGTRRSFRDDAHFKDGITRYFVKAGYLKDSNRAAAKSGTVWASATTFQASA